jgi:DNA-binding transcriptional MocR family regulator
MMLKNGSMQAVTLAGQALMSAPGDLVITESDTYSGTIAAYKGIGLEQVGTPCGCRRDAYGSARGDMMPVATISQQPC